MTTRASVCRALLKRFRSKDDLLLHLVTVDKTFIHYFEPENKAQTRQLVGSWSPRPKKFKTQPSAGKVGWLFGCIGLSGPLRQYFNLYRAVSQREGERGEKG